MLLLLLLMEGSQDDAATAAILRNVLGLTLHGTAGQGGFGKVYLGLRGGVSVAVKCSKASWASDAEALALQRLQPHPVTSVATQRHGLTRDSPFMLMASRSSRSMCVLRM